MEELQNNIPHSKLNDFKEVIEGFADLLVQENQALTEYNTDVVASLYERKAKIVAAYRSLVAYFIKNQQELSGIDEEERNSLKDAALNLDNLIKENEKLLKTRMETSQSVMNTIVNIAKITNNNNATSYGAQGRYSPLDNSKNALAVNRTL